MLGIVVFLEASRVYMQGVKKCTSFTMDFDHVAAVVEVSAVHVSIICFDVTLRDLGPIGQNYLLFVSVFEF